METLDSQPSTLPGPLENRESKTDIFFGEKNDNEVPDNDNNSAEAETDDKSSENQSDSDQVPPAPAVLMDVEVAKKVISCTDKPEIIVTDDIRFQEKELQSTMNSQSPISMEGPTSSNDAELKFVLDKSPGLSLIAQIESSQDSDTDSSSDSSDDDIVDDKDPVEWKDEQSVSESCPPRVKGEIDYRELPSEVECDIPFPPKATVLPIGEVSHYTEKVIVIKSFPHTPAVNQGTVLWREDKTSIARIFETFGPVKTPFYSILVGSEDRADKLGLAPGNTVFVVPGDLDLTNYVFTSKLLEEKGCDASWKNDMEMPDEYKECSDDEKEGLQKRQRKKRGHRRETGSATHENDLVNGNGSQATDHHLPTHNAAQLPQPASMGPYSAPAGHNGAYVHHNMMYPPIMSPGPFQTPVYPNPPPPTAPGYYPWPTTYQPRYGQ